MHAYLDLCARFIIIFIGVWALWNFLVRVKPAADSKVLREHFCNNEIAMWVVLDFSINNKEMRRYLVLACKY